MDQRLHNRRPAFGRNLPEFIIDASRKAGIQDHELSNYDVAVIKANPCGLRGSFRTVWTIGCGYQKPEFYGVNHYGFVSFTRKANVQLSMFEGDEING